jgi:peroxin-1
VLTRHGQHADSFRTRHLTETFLSTFSSASAHDLAPDLSNIVLIATAESQSALHPLLSASHLFKQVVHLKPLGKNARKQILAQVVQRRLEAARNLEVEAERPLNFVVLATETEGYSATDLQDLVARAVHQAVIRSSGDNDKVKFPKSCLWCWYIEMGRLGFFDCCRLQSCSSRFCASFVEGCSVAKIYCGMG